MSVPMPPEQMTYEGVSYVPLSKLAASRREVAALRERNEKLHAALARINSDYCDELRRVKGIAMLALGDDERSRAEGTTATPGERT